MAWKALTNTDSYEHNYVIYDSDSGLVIGYAVDYDDAQKIAAVPDMLEALEDAVIAIGEMDASWLGFEPIDGYPYKAELLDKIKAAIAKATKEI